METERKEWPKKTKIITDKHEIKKIIAIIQSYSKTDYYFSGKYQYSLLARGMQHEYALDMFKKFELVRYIEEDTLKFGDTGYDLYYEIKQDFHHFVIGVALNKKTGKLDFIHVYDFRKNLQKYIKIKKSAE